MEDNTDADTAAPTKFVYRVPRHDTHHHHHRAATDACSTDIDTIPHQINKELDAVVKQQKNLIDGHSSSKLWDKFKKLANEHELVHTTSSAHSIAACAPVSRSFFKLWEMLCDLEPELNLRHRPAACRVAFLAEGPGGFVEAFCKYRHGRHHDDVLYGMTLLSNDPRVPTWKLPQPLLDKHNITLLSGEDGTGSLLNVHNVDHLVRTVGAAVCDLVTADGGFDFSGDYNKQEVTSMRLIQAEVLAAVQLQAPHGHFCLKLFDMFTPQSYQLLWVLNQLYRVLYITKPHTSRPANSERYVMCVDFQGHTDTIAKRFMAGVLPQLRDAVATGAWCITAQPSTPFMYDMAEYNAHYMVKQVLHIQSTINLIQDSANKPSATTTSQHRALYHRQKLAAIAWCTKYGLPISPSTSETTQSGSERQIGQLHSTPASPTTATSTATSTCACDTVQSRSGQVM